MSTETKEDAARRARGDDSYRLDLFRDGPVAKDLGDGNDRVVVESLNNVSQIRLTLTSGEVGNGEADDSDSQPNQDGDLAVHLQAENRSGGLRGPESRFDDEGITFVTEGSATFDVRDLVSGVSRGDRFDVVQLGTEQSELLKAAAGQGAYYINGGAGADRIIGGTGNDFLVGGAGNDTLEGRDGDDGFIGGAGNDVIRGGAGDDRVFVNLATDGQDRVDLGAGLDTVNVTAPASAGQVRLTFTSSEVGNGSARDSDSLANQDGGFAVQLRAEDGMDGLGARSRYDDEGIRFVSATPGVTFDVRDLVSGVQRGDGFTVVELGTSGNDTITAAASRAESLYANGGMGNDRLTGGRGDDFLVGGAGNDVLRGAAGNDSFIGGAGNDVISGSTGDDTVIVNLATDGQDRVDLGAGMDVVNVTAPLTAGQVRLAFTSAEVGNGAARDGDSLANQDGGYAVQLFAEDGLDGLGARSRYDDEGISFVSSTPGVTFDVRDLVSGVQRGDQFSIVRLGTQAGDTIDDSAETRAVYVNGGMGDDDLRGGSGNDFLVGGMGNDRLDGGAGNDSFIGGAGNDVFVFAVTGGAERINDFVSGADKIDLSAFDIDVSNIASTTSGVDTILSIDTDRNGSSDFTITLVGVGRPADGDFLFA
ncbi:calcium-binding protein [Rhizobium sp. YIM 134829]|uniref:calcium-binding protein n=1 Tax=Rhizobium sp. YIM 134829 TaxID=3390453 RepID=UPI00397C4278